MKISHFLIIFCVLVFFLEFHFAADTITSISSIKDGVSKTTLVSSGQTFELGFFSPSNSKNRYIGIWYKITPDVVVWVANRNNPLNDSFGELTINNKGDIVLLDRAKSIIWSSNSTRVARSAVARLLDSGNLVLGESDSLSSKSYLWQSFDYPTDTLLTGMKLGWNLTSGFERRLTSWKSADEPSDGNFTCRVDLEGLPQIITAAGSSRMIRAGPWNGLSLTGITVWSINVYKPTFVFNENESYYMFEPDDNSVITRVKLNSIGQQQRLMLKSGVSEWDVMFSVPYDQCDNYGYCGPNGICRLNGDPICQCLDGFIPSSPEEREMLIWSSGCVRKTPLNCKKGDGFAKLSGVKLPDLLQIRLNSSMSLENCKDECLKDCSCVAYANSDARGRGSGCLMWFGDLIDVRELRIKGTEQDIYLRLSASDIKSSFHDTEAKRLKIILAASISSGIGVLAFLFGWIILKLRKKCRGKSKADDNIDLPVIDLAIIKIATKNFSVKNFIGEGGFGPVYSGKLSNGQEIAVKRLSKDSRQGRIEFKSEVDLIAKLQHKNLVALLGCCIQGDEKILIYEYMPNKSLDHFIFDDKRNNALSWAKTFDIVMGIARGLLYLHQDSKLQIIHRDLKASNILLDSNLNPKISDFGLARICRGDEKENRTKTVVGTYGYISPEYAVDGKFSVKSDVFSFGVLLLEIVSGKRNRRFSHPDHHHNLLGHAWLLWNEGQALELMDISFKDSLIESQVLKCVHVGLLCVQKYSEDRPTMNSAILMLANEGAKLPRPKEPGFFTERSSDVSEERSTSKKEDLYSENRVTITLDGR